MGKRRLVFDVAADHPFGADVEMRSGALLEVFGGFGHEHPYRIFGECTYAAGWGTSGQLSKTNQSDCDASSDLTSVTVSP